MKTTVSTWVDVGNGSLEEILEKIAESDVPSDAKLVEIDTITFNLSFNVERTATKLRFQWEREE